ncbi:MAG: ASCH domain-containing protein [Pseudomonadota bacterium]
MLKSKELDYWHAYVESLDTKPEDPVVEAGIAGNKEIADQLLDLFLKGQKTAASSLVTDFELSGDPLPKIGKYWIILDSKNTPKCIVKTTKIEFHQFSQVPETIAIAEGEGDLSMDYWRKAHITFFTPFLKDWGITDLDTETVVTEFYEMVFK